jgi:hypothetical protein
VVNYVPEKLFEAAQTARLTIEIMIGCNRVRICADPTRIIELPISFDFFAINIDELPRKSAKLDRNMKVQLVILSLFLSGCSAQPEPTWTAFAYPNGTRASTR